MLISLENVTKSFTKNPMLKDINLKIEENDRIGLVGINGSGKSTLLNIICKDIGCDEGEVSYKSNLKIGYLRQNSAINNRNTILEEIRGVYADVIRMGEKLRELEKTISQHKELHDGIYEQASKEYSLLQENFEKNDGYTFDVNINIVLNGMGFGGKDRNMSIASLSGGEKTRLALAKLLLEKPGLLILDEPTNHLDFETLMWLENYLESYKGAILTVSHDRYFLDKIVTRIWEIENTNIIEYKGNYSKYKLLREERIQHYIKQYEAQQREIASMEDYISKNIARASTANSAKSRVKALERMEMIEKPSFQQKTAKLRFTYDKEPVKDVLAVSGLEIAAGSGDSRIVLIDNVDFSMLRGEKIAIIGANGVGKSTFLKLILKKITGDKGDIEWGKNVKTSYYEQENLNLNLRDTALEELWKRFPREDEFTIRSTLGRTLLTGENVYKPVSVLSGGEKAKLAFAILLMEKSNTLVLDEPTNHLDLNTKEVLEESLDEYTGTLLFVTHDRYLLNRIPTKIVELTREGFVIYEGNFDYYLEKKQTAQAAKNQQEKTEKPLKEKLQDNPNYNRKRQRSYEAQRRVRISKLEQIIAQSEAEIDEMQKQMADPDNASDYQLISRLCEELETAKSELECYTDEWLELVE